MKHTIITCGLCGKRIWRRGGRMETGSVKFSLRILKRIVDRTLDGMLIDKPDWQRRVLYICPECVDKIKALCKGGDGA